MRDKVRKTDLGKIIFYKDRNKIKHPILIIETYLGLTLKEAYLIDTIKPWTKYVDIIFLIRS